MTLNNNKYIEDEILIFTKYEIFFFLKKKKKKLKKLKSSKINFIYTFLYYIINK